MIPKVDFEQLKEELIKAVNTFIDVCPEFNPKKKTGGILVYSKSNGSLLDVAEVGKIEGDPQVYYNAACRKIQQMFDNPDHLSSFPSRDPDNGLWGGGIHLFEIGLFAFSGLPELADEACLLKALENCGIIPNYQFMEEVLTLSENKIFEKLNC